jgi:hypothetical protein
VIPTSLRAVFAFAAVACFYGGVAGLVVYSNAWFVIALFAAAVFVVPAMFGGRKPDPDELPRIEEHLQRFRSAMLVCFIGAAGVYGTVLTGRGRMAWTTLQRLGGLGVSLWLVAFVLMFFVAYYSTQRRLATR